MITLQVRDATEADLPALTRIKPSIAVHRDRLRDAQKDKFRYLVLLQADTVLGFACLVFVRPTTWSDADDASRLPQIVDLTIATEARGQGLGSFFISSMERIVVQCGYQQLYLGVDPVDNPRACALYTRLGYQPLQTEPYRAHWKFTDSDGHVHQGDEWAIDMVKLL